MLQNGVFYAANQLYGITFKAVSYTHLKPAGATKGDWLLGLLVGLLILTIVGFIPYLGGLVHLGVVCLGLGAFVWQLYRVSRPAITT